MKIHRFVAVLLRVTQPAGVCKTMSSSSPSIKLNSQQSDLEAMDKDELVKRVLSLQRLCGQLRNAKTHKLSHYQEMEAKFKRKKPKKLRQQTRVFKNNMCRYVALKIAYLGWDYDGLQSNPNVEDTIERILRLALKETCLVDEEDPIKFTRSGRTDKGVSAFQQVVTLRIRTKFDSGSGIIPWDYSTSLEEQQQEDDGSVADSTHVINKQMNAEDMGVDEDESCDYTQEFDYMNILNRVLPSEIRVLAWAPLVDHMFSARFHCHGREYRYFFPKGKADIEKMNQAAQLFCGLHDFRNFGKLNVRSCTNYVRRIDHFTIHRASGSSSDPAFDIYYAQIIGSGFVYHQVRSMMAILFLIGIDKEQPELISQLFDLQNCPSKPAYGLVKGFPLTLFRTNFDPLGWQASVESYAYVLRHVYSNWSDLAIKAQMAKELVKEIETDSTITMYPGRTHELISNPEDAHSVQDIMDILNTTQAMHGVNRNLLLDSAPVNKNYKSVMSRPKCKSLEDCIQDWHKKRDRNNEDVTEPEAKVLKSHNDDKCSNGLNNELQKS